MICSAERPLVIAQRIPITKAMFPVSYRQLVVCYANLLNAALWADAMESVWLNARLKYLFVSAMRKGIRGSRKIVLSVRDEFSTNTRPAIRADYSGGRAPDVRGGVDVNARLRRVFGDAIIDEGSAAGRWRLSRRKPGVQNWRAFISPERKDGIEGVSSGAVGWNYEFKMICAYAALRRRSRQSVGDNEFMHISAAD